MIMDAKVLAKTLIDLDKIDIIDFATILYRKYVLKEENLDYTRLSDITVGLLWLTVGISYNEMHPTEEHKKKESYQDWIIKMSKCNNEI